MSRPTLEEFKTKITSIKTASAKLLSMIFSDCEYDSDIKIAHLAVGSVFSKISNKFEYIDVKSIILIIEEFLVQWFMGTSDNKVFSIYYYLLDLLENDKLINLTLNDIFTFCQVFDIKFDDDFLKN